MSTLAQRIYSGQEYLALERAAETKSEFINGMIYAMAGASRTHNAITLNIGAELRAQLGERSCEPFVNDLRVKVDATRLYTYPDVVVVCGEPRFEDDHVDTLLNPTVIVEVLSPSTEAYDRGAKFAHYQQSDSLTDYVLVSQDRCRVEHYARQGEQWIYRAVTDLADQLDLPSIECSLSLLEIYRRVTFPEAESTDASSPDGA